MYIEKGREGQLGMWKYLPIPILFIGLMGMNYLAVKVLELDTTTLMAEQINAKGKIRVFIESMGVFIFLLGGLFFWVRYVHRQSILSLTTIRKKMDWSRFFFIFLLMSAFIIASTLISYFTASDSLIFNFDPVPFLILLAVAIILVPIQTSFEEYMFRGYLMQGLGLVAKKRWIPLLVTSILFGVMHIANPEVEKIGSIVMFYYIGTGLFLGVITLMDEGLELALGFHAANNLITVLLVTSDWTALQTDSIFIDTADPNSGYEILLPILVVFPLFIFILSKKYKWTGWSEKLLGSISE